MLKSVKKRISEWLPNNQPDTNFTGTEATYETYRAQWVLNCSSATSTGLLQSKKNAYGQCQQQFDSIMQPVANRMSVKRLEQQQQAEEQTENLTYIIVVGALLISAIWLLKS